MASTALMLSTVSLAWAANYPQPFQNAGTAAVVWGSTAANTDLSAVTDIVASLQSAIGNQGSSSSDTTTVEGDSFKIERSSDRLNLGNTMSGVFGSTVDDDDLGSVLADGTYLNDENTEYDYEQRLALQALQLTFFTDSDFDNEEPTIGFQIASSTPVLNYTLDFTTDPESDVSSDDLVDFETTDIEILGKNYYILDAKNGSASTYFGKFTFLDSANTETVTEGESKTISVGSSSYEVAIDFISSNSVKLSVNGQTTNSLAEGETFKLANGVYVGIKDILYDTRDNTVSSVEFSIGSGKLEIEAGSEIQLNDEEVDGVMGWVVRGTASSSKQRMDKIVIQWMTDDEAFIAENGELVMPGFEAVKFLMTDFVVPESEELTVGYAGDDDIELSWPFKDGKQSFVILHANASGEFTLLGEDTDKRLATSQSSVLVYNETVSSTNYHTRFVATYSTTDDAESYLLSAKVTESEGRNRTSIKNEVTGQTVCEDKIAGDICNIGDVALTITGVARSGTARSVIFTGGTGVNFSTIFTEGGLKAYLPVELTANATGKGAINFTGNTTENVGHSPGSFVLFFEEEDKDDDKGEGSAFNVTLNDDSDGDVEVSDIDTSENELDIPGSSDDVVSRVYSDLATEVKRTVSGDRGKAVITYGGMESYANVYLAEVGATTSGSGSTTNLGVVHVKDSEVSTVSSRNMVIVGGSCVNTVAARLLGSSSSPLCGDDFTAKTQVGSGQFLIQSFESPWSAGKVAVLVAGYNDQDTQNAATYLRTQSVDTAVGKKYIGTTATQATLQTSS